MTARLRTATLVLVVALLALALAACDGGGEVRTGDGGTGTASATGTGSGSGTGTGTGLGVSVEIEGKVNNHGAETLTGAAADLEMEADDFYFGPTFVKAEPGSTVTVKLHNEGDASHTFTIDEIDVDVALDPGAEGEAEFTLPDAGPVVFYCRFHGTDGMQGAFHFD